GPLGDRHAPSGAGSPRAAAPPPSPPPPTDPPESPPLPELEDGAVLDADMADDRAPESYTNGAKSEDGTVDAVSARDQLLVSPNATAQAVYCPSRPTAAAQVGMVWTGPHPAKPNSSTRQKLLVTKRNRNPRPDVVFCRGKRQVCHLVIVE